MKKKRLIFVLVLLILSSLVSAGTLKVTSEHPFLINGEWIPASELKIGDRLTEINGKIVEITSIKKIIPKDPFLVYNLEAGKYHNFVVRDTDNLSIVVHNSNKQRVIRGRTPNSYKEFGKKLKTFYTVQGPRGINRLETNSPYPTAPNKANLGCGVYSWDNIKDARIYMARLTKKYPDIDLKIVEIYFEENTLNSFKSLDIDSLGEIGADIWMKQNAALWVDDNPAAAFCRAVYPTHGMDYIVRGVGELIPGEIAREHFFTLRAIDKAKHLVMLDKTN